MRRKGWKLPAAASLVAALGACTSTTDTTTASSAVQTTSLAVRPVDFLGSVACTNQAGGMRSFVATATDLDRISATILLQGFMERRTGRK